MREHENNLPHVRDRFDYLDLLSYLAMFAAVALLPTMGNSPGVTALVASALVLAGLCVSSFSRIRRRKYPQSIRGVLGGRLTQEHVAVIRSWSLLGSETEAVNKICRLYPELSASEAHLLLEELARRD